MKRVLKTCGLALALSAATACGSGGDVAAPTELPVSSRFQGSLADQQEHFFRFGIEVPGALQAQVSWTGSENGVRIGLQETDPPFTTLALSESVGATASLSATVEQGEYLVFLGNFSGSTVEYELTVTHPRGGLLRGPS